MSGPASSTRGQSAEPPQAPSLDPEAVGLRSMSTTVFAVVDIETTGLIPGNDRIVELAVVRVEPDCEPRLVMETLVDPERPMAATEIHGIGPEDVAGAPRFRDLIGDLAEALSGCCLASYNSAFDIALLQRELAMAGVKKSLPHICLMGLGSDFGLGPGGSLEEACRFHEIPFHAGHRAAYDALSQGHLLTKMLPSLKDRGLRNLGHLLHHSRRKYCQSLILPPLPGAADLGLTNGCSLLPRPRETHQIPDTRRALGLYFDALQAAIADGILGGREMADLDALRRRFALRPQEIRCLHARLYGVFLALYCEDTWLAESEAQSLQSLHRCLQQLGWAPGD